MIKCVLLFILGLLLLIKGGDWFVDGASSIARRFHIPELLLGATVVAIGTTVPEVMVSATSAVRGIGEMAYGNALGSIICNTALIAAITMAVRPAECPRETIKLPLTFFYLAAIFYTAVAYFGGFFARWVGLVLLLIFVIYIVLCARQAVCAGKAAVAAPAAESEEKAEEEMPIWKALLLLIVGAVLIAIGANLLVDNGTIIAEALGVPNSVIALTFVALGTSLPELVTAITALIKGHSDLSLGNVIGANLFNMVLVTGTSASLAPFHIPVEKQIAGMNASLVVDFPVMLGVMLLMTIPVLIKQKMYRWQGISLLVIYASFCVFQLFI